jgi:tetratricopeptide (TPR) repeat protein
VREDLGEILMSRGRTAPAIEQFQRSLAVLDKLPDAKNVHTLNGWTAISDQLGLGKAHLQMASTGKLASLEAAQHYREARAWFNKCLPGFEEIRDHAPPQYGGAERVAEIKSAMARCNKNL